jgi:hypothetical protein
MATTDQGDFKMLGERKLPRRPAPESTGGTKKKKKKSQYKYYESPGVYHMESFDSRMRDSSNTVTKGNTDMIKDLHQDAMEILDRLITLHDQASDIIKTHLAGMLAKNTL